MFLAAARFPERGKSALRGLIGISLALLWIPPLHFALLAVHRAYLLFPVLTAFAGAVCVLATTSRSLDDAVEA